MNEQYQRQAKRYHNALEDGDYDYAEYLLDAMIEYERQCVVLTQNDDRGTMQV